MPSEREAVVVADQDFQAVKVFKCVEANIARGLETIKARHYTVLSPFRGGRVKPKLNEAMSISSRSGARRQAASRWTPLHRRLLGRPRAHVFTRADQRACCRRASNGRRRP